MKVPLWLCQHPQQATHTWNSRLMTAMHACQAVEWGGKKKIVVNSKRPVPVITDPVRANGCTCKCCSACMKFFLVYGMLVVGSAWSSLDHVAVGACKACQHGCSQLLPAIKLLAAAGGCHHQSHIHGHLWFRPAHVRFELCVPLITAVTWWYYRDFAPAPQSMLPSASCPGIWRRCRACARVICLAMR